MNFEVLKSAIIYTSMVMGYVVILRSLLLLVIESIREIYKHIKGVK